MICFKSSSGLEIRFSMSWARGLCPFALSLYIQPCWRAEYSCGEYI